MSRGVRRRWRTDIVIIGGGLSGLAAAVELASRGAAIILCEQAPQLGGRCFSYIDRKTGDVVDNGQHLLLGAYHNTLDYLERIGSRQHLRTQRRLAIPLHHPERGFAAFEIPPAPRPFHLPGGMLKFGLLNLGDRSRLMKVGFALSRWDQALERRLSAMTVAQWLTALGQSEEARTCLWYPIAVSVMNDLPERSSALLFARVLHKAFLGDKKDASILIPSVGQSQLYVEGAAEYLKGCHAGLFKNTEVKGLAIEGSAVSGVVLKGGGRIDARCVISAVPYFSLERIVPAGLRAEKPFAGLRKIESSPIVSLHLWFDKEFMETDFVGLIGRRIQWLFNRRRILEGEKKSSGYVSAIISGARRYIDLTKENLISIALDDLCGLFPGASPLKLLSSIVIKERRATFSPTCEGEGLRPSAETPIRNLYLAGDWTNTGLPATLEGAVTSGYRAARLIR